MLSCTVHHRHVTALLQGLAECHGMASGLLHHSESVLFNQTGAAPHSMVYALLGEFSSHRTHLSTFLAIAKPVFLTRLILLSTQVCLATLEHLACTASVLQSTLSWAPVPIESPSILQSYPAVLVSPGVQVRGLIRLAGLKHLFKIIWSSASTVPIPACL